MLELAQWVFEISEDTASVLYFVVATVMVDMTLLHLLYRALQWSRQLLDLNLFTWSWGLHSCLAPRRRLQDLHLHQRRLPAYLRGPPPLAASCVNQGWRGFRWRRQRARSHWIRAVTRIRRLMWMRRTWAFMGHALQMPRVRALVCHLPQRTSPDMVRRQLFRSLPSWSDAPLSPQAASPYGHPAAQSFDRFLRELGSPHRLRADAGGR